MTNTEAIAKLEAEITASVESYVEIALTTDVDDAEIINTSRVIFRTLHGRSAGDFAAKIAREQLRAAR